MLILCLVAGLVTLLDESQPPLDGQGRASDGDSLRLGTERIRLIGLDAPELAQHCTDDKGRQWTCGRAARDAMAALLSLGPLQCLPEGQDRYGRVLATCQIGGDDLGAALVAQGMAVSAGAYWVEQETARRARLGIWTGDFKLPRQWRDDEANGQGVFGWLADLLPRGMDNPR